MADKNISQLDNLDSSTIAGADEFAVYDATASTTKAITKTELDKSIGEVLDSLFRITDNSDTTKKVAFDASGITTGNTRTITIPDANITLTGIATSQTLTNKTIDPSLNTIDGDKLDIDFTPTNYTPTTTGASEADDTDDLAAHLKGIDNAILSSTKSFMVPVLNALQGTLVGEFPTESLAAAASAYFAFKIPDDFVTLIEAVIVVIPDATETIQWDLATNFGLVGELYNANTDAVTNATQAVTVSILSELPVGDGLTGITAGDYVGLNFNSNTSNIRVVGLFIKYNT
jgi:hypothetical protein